MRNPSITKIVTITEIVTYFCPHENVTIMSHFSFHRTVEFHENYFQQIYFKKYFVCIIAKLFGNRKKKTFLYWTTIRSNKFFIVIKIFKKDLDKASRKASLRRILSEISIAKYRLGGAFVLSIFSSSIMMSVPYFTGFVIDHAVNGTIPIQGQV